MLNKMMSCDYPCGDIQQQMIFPRAEVDRNRIRMVMISEAPPVDPANYFYTNCNASFFRTTQTAFKDGGVEINDYDDLFKMGIYLTTAIKCSKKDYLVSAQTIKRCSNILEEELAQFPNVKVIMCMGDFAIKAVNYIYKRKWEIAPIKNGSTYKIRKEEHILNGIRFFPSYTHTGDSFNIEKIKRQMIAEDIIAALNYLNLNPAS